MNSRKHSKLLSLLVTFSSLRESVTAFSTSTNSNSQQQQQRQPRAFVQLSNPLTNKVSDQLPSSYVSNWPLWILETKHTNDKSSSDEINHGEITRIPDGSTKDNKEGFVNPFSIDELWQPVDMISPQLKLCLGLHVRDGSIRHAMPALDVYLNGKKKSNFLYRNRGLSSIPRAYKWVDFQALAFEDLSEFELVLETRKAIENESDGDEVEWKTLFEFSGQEKNAVKDALNQALFYLSSEPPQELQEGSNIVYVVLPNTASVDCPRPGYEIRAVLREKDISQEELFLGVLEVQVTASMAGSESEYLPEAYKSLYHEEESLKYNAYTDWKERVNSRKPKKEKDGDEL